MLKNNSGLIDIIRCDQKDYLMWKWHPNNAELGKSSREDFIRWGSPLRVKDGEVAVFVCSGKEGSVQDYIEGPADCILSTENLPLISDLVGLAYGGGTQFPAEVYFINLAQIIQQKVVVPYFDVFDPRFTDFSVPVAVKGTITFKITDINQFIKLHRLVDFSLIDFNNQVKDSVSRYVKNTVANAPSDYDIPVIQLERRIEDINSLIESNIRLRFFNDFGVTVANVDIASIDVDKTSEGYIELKKVTKDLTSEALKAQSEVNIKEMKDRQKLGIFEKVGKIFTNFTEDKFAKRKQNIKGTYELSTEPVIDKNGEVHIPGLASKKENSNFPPMLSTKEYYVAINGSPTGPYNISSLKQMLGDGKLGKETLLWTEGMNEWVKAEDIADLKSLFIQIPPIPKI